jgi:simple sugar transport system permease protein
MDSAQEAKAVTIPVAAPAAVAPRPAVMLWRPKVEAVVIPVGAVFAGCVLFGFFCITQGKNPFAVFAAIYKAAFHSWYAFQNTLLRAAPLMLTALCTALPARLGLIVIGNEGALVIGGLVATVVGLAVQSAPMPVVIACMFMGGVVGGGLWITIVGLLYYKRGVNETISSLLMNYIAIAIMNHLVNGIMRDPSSLNKPSR